MMFKPCLHYVFAYMDTTFYDQDLTMSTTYSPLFAMPSLLPNFNSLSDSTKPTGGPCFISDREDPNSVFELPHPTVTFYECS